MWHAPECLPPIEPHQPVVFGGGGTPTPLHTTHHHHLHGSVGRTALLHCPAFSACHSEHENNFLLPHWTEWGVVLNKVKCQKQQVGIPSPKTHFLSTASTRIEVGEYQVSLSKSLRRHFQEWFMRMHFFTDDTDTSSSEISPLPSIGTHVSHAFPITTTSLSRLKYSLTYTNNWIWVIHRIPHNTIHMLEWVTFHHFLFRRRHSRVKERYRLQHTHIYIYCLSSSSLRHTSENTQRRQS